MNNSMERMKELVKILREAGKAYYQESREIMSNLEYDKLYDELLELEKETGTVFANSPTQNVGYEVISELPKVVHEKPMLSLDKTKSTEELASWLGGQQGILSWKLDGLTIVLTYREGRLYQAVTRGNGLVGELVTNNARVFANLPLLIPCKGEVILRGEAIIKYSDFEVINKEIGDADAKYKNPRNLCAGSVRQLNNEITAKRNVQFIAFSLVKAEGVDFKNSREEQFKWLAGQGFETVQYRRVDKDTVSGAVMEFAEKISDNDFPSDGLVLTLDDIEYGESLGATAKFPRNSIAFKWQDEQAVTRLKYIEWSPSRTGLINPVAVFEPVELEGTTVSRASVHNISILESLELGEGDEISVYKANMIIPQIAENHTRSGMVKLPDVCPVCGGATELVDNASVKSLYCTNPECQAKKIKAYALFVSRDAMNIDGMSEATLEKFIDAGFIKEYADIYRLSRFKEQIVNMEGFGEKSYEKIAGAVEASREVPMHSFLYALGIGSIGVANAKMICRAFGYDFEKIRHATREELEQVEGIGTVIADVFAAYFEKEENNRAVDSLLEYVTLTGSAASGGQKLKDITFVITGSLNHFGNRNELKEIIENLGGKVTGSVTSKTSYLINNDISSDSSKNKKARELGIAIISEEEVLKMIEE